MPLEDYDFDGHDLIDDKKFGDPFKNQFDGVYPSILHHEAKERIFTQPDGYNCGIVSLIHCLEKFQKNEKFHKLSFKNQKE